MKARSLNIAVMLFMFMFYFSGCSNKVPEPVSKKIKDVEALILTDDHKVTYIKKRGGIDRFCSSPETDAVSSYEKGFSFGVNTIATSDGVGEQSGRSELGLGGRSPAVLISREFLYRACELSVNLNANSEDTISIYKMFLKSLENVVKNHFNQGTQPMSSNLPSYTISDNLIKKDKPNQDDSDSGDDTASEW
jgi:hypothetical protein